MAAKKDVNQAPVAAVDDDMEEWHGKFGGNVDGWWSPAKGSEGVITGIISNFINKDRSDKLQSNTIVLELTAPCDGVKNGGSEKIDGSKGDNKLHKAGIGCMIGVPEWKQLEGMWPAKAGFKVEITRSAEKRDLGKGRSMYDIKTRTSKARVKEVVVYEEDATSETAGGGMAPAEQFQVES